MNLVVDDAVEVKLAKGGEPEGRRALGTLCFSFPISHPSSSYSLALLCISRIRKSPCTYLKWCAGDGRGVGDVVDMWRIIRERWTDWRLGQILLKGDNVSLIQNVQ